MVPAAEPEKEAESTAAHSSQTYDPSESQQNENSCTNNDHTCKANHSFIWCLPSDYNQEDDPFRYSYLTNKSLPWSYDFKFIIKEVSNVNDKAQTIQVSMYFGVSWFEPRLRINESAEDWKETKMGPPDEVNVSPETLKYLWYPELEIYGLENFHLHRVLKEMSGVRIIKNQTIHYELRVGITISCQMTFDDYPLDSHSCPFQIGSYYGTDKTVICSSHYAFDEERQRSLQHFIKIKQLSAEDQTVILPSGDYAACGFTVELNRMRMQNIVQVYLPSTMFVMVSWVSFLIKPEVVPGRMALLVTLFLVLTNIFNGVKASAPVSKRLNAVDLYLVVCIFLVFGALLEYALILFMQKKLRQPGFPTNLSSTKTDNDSPASKEQNQKIRSTSQSSSPLPSSGGGGGVQKQNASEKEAHIYQTKDGSRVEVKIPSPVKTSHVRIAIHPHEQHSTDSLCENIDSIALWISPLVFILFNAIYWMHYF